jgi:hypothetical protein
MMMNDIVINMANGEKFDYKTDLSTDELFKKLNDADKKGGFIKLNTEEFISDVIVNTKYITSIIIDESED